VICGWHITESQHHRMAQVGRGLKDHEAPTPPPQAGPPKSPSNTRPGCPGPPSNLALNTSRVFIKQCFQHSEVSFSLRKKYIYAVMMNLQLIFHFFYYYFFKSLFSVNPKASANKRGAPEMQGSFPGRMQQIYKGLGKNDFTKP